MRHSERRFQTKRLAICAVLSALAVVVLGLGMLIEVMDLTCAAMASLVILPILLGYGPRYAVITYAVVSTLGILLMPQSLSAWLYVGLAGYYPIIRPSLQKLPKAVTILIKLLLVLAVLALYMVVFYFFVMGGEGTFLEAFLSGFGEKGGSMWLSIGIIGLSILTFFVFDLLIDRLLILYQFKWKQRVDKWMK